MGWGGTEGVISMIDPASSALSGAALNPSQPRFRRTRSSLARAFSEQPRPSSARKDRPVKGTGVPSSRPRDLVSLPQTEAIAIAEGIVPREVGEVSVLRG